jgi:ferritin-like metal-binding protein YciE
MSTPQETLTYELQELMSAESQLIGVMPKWKGAASSPELSEAIRAQLALAKAHKKRLQEVGALLGCDLNGPSNATMEGLVSEVQAVLDELQLSAARDAALVAVAQRVEQYEIAAYESAIALAKTLENEEAVALLEASLQEQVRTEKSLQQLAESTILPRAEEESSAPFSNRAS